MTATAQHTPGPWEFDDSCEVYPMPSIRMNGVIICRMVKQKTADEYDANGRLLAAAPDLLEACRYLVKQIDLSKLNIRRDFSLINGHAAATRAIRKAEVA